MDLRVNMLYLVDAMLQSSQRPQRGGDAADAAAAPAVNPLGRMFRDTIAAALPRCAAVCNLPLCRLVADDVS